MPWKKKSKESDTKTKDSFKLEAKEETAKGNLE